MNQKRRWVSLLLAAALLLSLLPTMVFAAGNTAIYTDMNYKGQEDGTQSKPYSNFETAVAKAQDGDTIVIKGKAFANVREESGVSPLVIDKRVTITGENDAVGELYVRAGGIILGADVIMTNVELNLANKYHNAIYVNGYKFTATNVTRGSGSREVHLYAGGIGEETQVKTELPASGTNAVLTLTNSTFGDIFAAGVLKDFFGNVIITASDSNLGNVYASGTSDRAPDGNWFDTSEPAAPDANAWYIVDGAVSVTTDGSSITNVNAMGNSKVTVTVNNALESRMLTLHGARALIVNGGTATLAEVEPDTVVTVSGNASLDLSRLTSPTLGSLTGDGTLVLGKTQTLSITDTFDGTWAFETVNGFNGKSGVAEYSHTYITAGSGNATVSFQPHDTQSGMTLDKTGNAWKTSSAPEIPEVVRTFAIDGATSKTLAVDKIGLEESYIPVQWTSPAASPDNASLTAIPFRYVVTYNGQEYAATSVRDADKRYFAEISLGNKQHMELAGSDRIDEIDDSYDGIQISGNLTAGVYQIAIFAPDADGNEIRQDFTLIVTDGTAKTATTVTVNANAASFGDTFSATASVQANSTEVAGATLEYWLNGKQITSLENLKVLLRGGFLLGENELRVVYAGNDTYAPSVATATFTVSKATTTITGVTLPTGGTFNGSAYTVTLNAPKVEVNDTVLDDGPAVTVEYRLDGKMVNAAVFPGEYTVVLRTAEGKTYQAIETEAGGFTIEKATPTVTVNAENKGNGTVELTATVAGIDPYFATGKVSFTWGNETFEATLTNGTASHTVTGVDAKEYTYKAAFVPDNDPYYLAASSTEKTITPTVPAVTLDKIEIVTPPTKATYTEGETFDKAGMVVKATYSDGSSKELGENEYTVAPATALTAADALVTISYGGKTATQQITVNKASAQTYTLSFDVNGGKERIASQTLAAGATPAAVTAPTRDGYAFAGWKYGETVVDLATFQMPTEDVELVAQWNIITYTIHFSAGNTGASGTAEDMTYQFDGNHDRQKLPSGNDFSLAGHWFVGWSVTVGDKTTIILAGSEITSEIRKALLASENHEITLYMVWKQFAVVTNTITASSGANGSITPSGEVIVEEGEDQTFTIRAASGYEIEDVLVDGVSVGAVLSYTFQNVTAAHTISATFKKSADTPIPPKPPVKPEDPIAPIWPILPTLLNPQTTDSGISRWLDTVQPKAYLSGYANGTFQPKKSMTRAEAAQMIYNLLLDGQVDMDAILTDVAANAWYAKAVNTLATLGVITGYSDGSFRPNDTITRAEFLTILMRMSSGALQSGSSFKDVSTMDWFYTAVAHAVEYGWVNGYADGTFRPNAPISRAEVAAIINRVLQRTADRSYMTANADKLTSFRDVRSSDWFYADVMAAANTSGYSTR